MAETTIANAERGASTAEGVGASPIAAHVLGVIQAARDAQPGLARATGALRRAALQRAAAEIRRAAGRILEANAADLGAAEGLTTAQRDRLRLDPARIEQMAAGVEAVAAQPDVVGRILDGWVLDNGVRVRRVRVPLGVVGVIYENRPNVTADAAALGLWAGNAVVLRGSSQALRSNRAIAAAFAEGIGSAGLDPALVGLVEDTTREGAIAFMQAEGLIDLLVPRGGPSLIAAIREHATVPVVIDGDGNCHVYVDRAADLAKAARIVENAKLQRPGVCNAAETLVVHEAVAEAFLPMVAQVLAGCELRGDERTRELVGRAVPATEDDYAREFLDAILAVRVVGSLEEAIAHVRRYSTGHSEAIVTEDRSAAERFVAEVDAAAVLVNASTRFVDGGQLGFGAEIGISTQKLHWRGPMGAEALTSVKLVIEGDGQVRA
jgi:glutamate-5-semialdehyde dehydrogenase